MLPTVFHSEMAKLRGIFLENREELHTTRSNAFKLARTNRLEVFRWVKLILSRLSQITTNNSVTICLKRRQSLRCNFKTGITSNAQAIGVTLGRQ